MRPGPAPGQSRAAGLDSDQPGAAVARQAWPRSRNPGANEGHSCNPDHLATGEPAPGQPAAAPPVHRRPQRRRPAQRAGQCDRTRPAPRVAGPWQRPTESVSVEQRRQGDGQVRNGPGADHRRTLGKIRGKRAGVGQEQTGISTGAGPGQAGHPASLIQGRGGRCKRGDGPSNDQANKGKSKSVGSSATGKPGLVTKRHRENYKGRNHDNSSAESTYPSPTELSCFALSMVLFDVRRMRPSDCLGVVCHVCPCFV